MGYKRPSLIVVEQYGELEGPSFPKLAFEVPMTSLNKLCFPEEAQLIRKRKSSLERMIILYHLSHQGSPRVIIVYKYFCLAFFFSLNTVTRIFLHVAILFFHHVFMLIVFYDSVIPSGRCMLI